MPGFLGPRGGGPEKEGGMGGTSQENKIKKGLKQCLGVYKEGLEKHTVLTYTRRTQSIGRCEE